MLYYRTNENARIIGGYLIIAVLSAASCCGSIFGDFVFDDAEAILNNKDISTETPISNIFLNDFWGTRLTHNLSHKSYRPLTVLTFRLNYAVFNRLVSWSFHLVNIILHVTVSLLLWSVYDRILCEVKSLASLWGACLFAVHPIHTEAVSGIVGRADLLAAFFFLISFLLHCCSISESRLQFVWFTSSIMSAAAAMFSKEYGVTVLGFNLVYELFAVQKLDQRILDRRRWKAPLATISLIRSILLIVAGVCLVWLRCYLMDFRSPTFQRGDNPASFAEDWCVRVSTEMYIVGLNAWLMVCPDWLCFDWSMGCIPLINSVLDHRLLMTLLFWLALMAVAAVALLNSAISGRREILLSLALMVIPFIPASNLLFRVGFVIAERVLYIPSAGYCLLVAIGLERLASATKKDFTFAFYLLLVVFLIKSHLRSLEWRTEVSLFNSALRVCPLNAKVRYNVAKSAADRGYEERAIEQYREAIRLFPEYDQALNNLANLLKSRGELLDAEKLLRKALRIRSDFPAAWMNLGIVLASRRQFDEAEKCYQNALKLRKIYPDCYYNLGNLYLEQNKFSEAEEAWLNATRLKPEMSLAWNNLIVMKDGQGNHSEAVAAAEAAIAAAGELPSFHFNMANALGKMSLYVAAEQHFKKALELDSGNALYYVNLGVLYHRWKRYELAEESYVKALKISPTLSSAKQNYKMLKKQMLKLKSNR